MKYKINEKTYTQKKLTLGQIKKLIEIMNDIPDAVRKQGIMPMLMYNLPAFLAVVLIEEEKTVRESLEDFENKMKFFEDVDYETALKVVEDFFTYNQISLLLSVAEKISKAITKTT